MKLKQNEQVAIYASALEGVIKRGETTNVKAGVLTALQFGDELIAALEARTESNPHEEITD